MGLRAFGWAAAGIALGFVLGGVPVERERAALEQRVTELEQRLARSSRPNILENFLPQLGQRGPQPDPGAASQGDTASAPADGRAPTGSSADAAREVDPRPAGQGDVVVIGGERDGAREQATDARRQRWRDEAGDRARPWRGESDAERPADLERARARGPRGRPALERFDQLANVQRARAAASRVALIEQAGLDEAQVARMDQSVRRMNDQLAGYGEEMIDQMVREEAPAPAQALGLGHDISGILFEGQKELDALVGDAAEGVEPSALEVWNYVDVEQWRPFVEARLGEQPAAPASATGQGAPAPAEGSAGSGAPDNSDAAPAGPSGEAQP